MGFWLFGGNKKKRLSKLQDQNLALAQENIRPDTMARVESSGLQDTENVASGETSRNMSRTAMSTSRDSATSPLLRNHTTPAIGRSTSRRSPMALIEQFSKHEPILNFGERDSQSSMYRQNAASRSSIVPESFTVVKGPPALRRRSDLDSGLPRHKSSKRKAEEHAREREVKAMSSPTPNSKRSTRRSEGPLRKETKKIPGDLNRHLERPKSEVSLPLPETFSEMTDFTDQHSFKVNAFAVLGPRPTIKYSGSSRFTSRSQNQSRASARDAIAEEDFPPKKRIDELADSLDSGGLRELMERDKRRRERKKESDKAKLHRKLRRAERQREEESRRGRDPEARPYSQKGKDVTPRDEVRSGPSTDTPAAKEEIKPIGEPETRQPSSPVLATAAEGITQDDPFDDNNAEESVPREQSHERSGEKATEPTLDLVPQEEIKTEMPTEPLIDSSQVKDQALEPAGAAPELAPASEFKEPEIPVRSPLRIAEGGPISPPQSPTQAPKKRASFSQVAGPTKDRAGDGEDLAETGRRGSDQSGSNAWTSFFRRGGRRKRSPIAPERSATSEFSNTSRESFSRQQPPPTVPPRSFRRSGSGTPQRTRSKFREDLPELPLSPPDSRVQSPEVESARTNVPVAISESNQLDRSVSNPTDRKSLAISGSIPTLDRSRQDEHDDAPAPAGMSQSLASVDSEASWLSGKPVKRGSVQMGHPLRQSQSSLQPLSGDESDGGEAKDVAEDEYFHRLTPGPDERRRSSSASAMRKASSTVIDLGGDDEPSPQPEVPQIPDRAEETWHGSVGRQATIVRQTSRAKSKEGLLNEFQADEPVEEEADEEEEMESPGDDLASPEFETPAEELQTSPILRARSVEYGKGHARHISAGSARLLDIRRSSVASEAISSQEKSQTPTRAVSIVRAEEEKEEQR